MSYALKLRLACDAANRVPVVAEVWLTDAGGGACPLY